MAKTSFFQTNPEVEEYESSLVETSTTLSSNSDKSKTSFYSSANNYEYTVDATSIVTDAQAAQVAAEAAQAAAEAAQTAAELAETNAETAETNAETAETNASAAQTAAVAAQSYAEEWANKDEDSLVSAAAGGDLVDDYSAKHFSLKAEDYSILTAADAVSTAADAIATAADRVQTGLDVVATNADVVQTGLDLAATDADTIATAADVVTTGNNVTYAAEWAVKAEDLPVSVAAGGDASTTFSALHWAAKAAATAAAIGDLNSLSDVTITSVASNELVAYTGAGWENQTFTELGLVTLTGTETLTNKTITAPTFDTYFDVTPTTAPTHTEGRVYYDSTEKALSYYNDEADVTLNIGQENFIRCRNTTGVTITNGQAVYISGATGANLPNVSLAQADALDTARCIGLATHDIENNSNGYITTLGLVRDVDTSSFSAGAPLFLSTSTPGALTTTRPTTGYAVMVGYCTISNVSVGEIKVLPGATVQEASLLTDADIGATVQAYDADLTTWASLTPSANAQSLVTAANYAAMRTLLDLEAGTDFYSISGADAAFQPLDADLTSWAGVTRAAGFDTFAATPTTANFLSLVTDETFVMDTDIGVTVQAYDADLDTWASLTPSANAQSLVTAANYAAMRTLLDLEAGTDFYSISAADAAFEAVDADIVRYDVAGAFTTDQDFQAQLEISEEILIDGLISPTQITATQNDYAPTGIGTANVVRIDSDAARNITGISASQAEGRVLILQNDGAFTITLPDEDAGSTAANRFDLAGATDFELQAGAACLLIYDGTASRWRIIGGAGGGGGGGASVSLSDTAPGAPSAGDLWARTTDFALFVYYTDVDSSQWVQVSGGGGGSPNILYDDLNVNGYSITGNATITGWGGWDDWVRIDVGTDAYPVLMVEGQGSTTYGPWIITNNLNNAADNDVVGGLEWRGKNDAGTDKGWAFMYSSVEDASATTEDAVVYAQAIRGGSNALEILWGGGVHVGPTDDRQGAGTLNAQNGLYDGSNRIGSVLLAGETTVSSAASFDIDFSAVKSTYSGFQIRIWDLQSANDIVDISLRFSTDGGSTFASGTSDYQFVRLYGTEDNVTGASGNIGSDALLLTNNQGNAANEEADLIIEIQDCGNTGRDPQVYCRSWYEDNNSDQIVMLTSGRVKTNQDTDAIRLLFQSGNITYCQYTVTGFHK